MNEGDTVTLAKDVPNPDDWERTAPQSYYYVHKETGRQIHEEAFFGIVERRNQLAEYIEEIDEHHTARRTI